MEKVYADLIRKGAINPKTEKAYSLDDVPKSLKNKVRALLGDLAED